ncbi:MAG: bifunctional phosphopantothenoylcysteine decarboxylase/phosphopantothenate--cysteine ligase CoaBC [Rikenellaceae bacterium]|nr:bifunctional phosphopantothenoylcysteine decarboxylase/phosphopantothenate--cysteine ligase CoaBC [Rikenellaceae bacterium]
MVSLNGKNIVVGVTGSIAVFKAAILVRLLTGEGANVKVVMTPLAKEFITPLTMATVSKNPILVDFFNPENGEWNSHVSLGEWADAYLIAPATANTIAKMAGGIADNLLLTTYLSAKCPVFIAPAMDLDMYAHTATQDNIARLKTYGNHIIEPGVGELASGLVGKGRMAEPVDIVGYLNEYFCKCTTLTGKKIMVTAGGTIEAIDPVRFISNHSSGKMGVAIAEELASRGAEVTLIKGNITVPVTDRRIKIIEALSAEGMYKACTEIFPNTDAAVMCAAVADYTPSEVSGEKIKKDESNWLLPLKRTKDIAGELGKLKQGRLLVGFALETTDEDRNALRKLKEKNLDFILLNSLRDEGAGFGHDTNKIAILHQNGSRQDYPVAAKKDLAKNIADTIENYLL